MGDVDTSLTGCNLHIFWYGGHFVEHFNLRFLKINFSKIITFIILLFVLSFF